MHSNKKYSEPHGPHTNNFKIKMVIEILSRRCTETGKDRGRALGEISKSYTLRKYIFVVLVLMDSWHKCHHKSIFWSISSLAKENSDFLIISIGP